MRVDRVMIREEHLRTRLLPRLVGSVFHVTSRRGYAGIRRAGGILNNQTSRFPYTAAVSANSVGRKRGWICLFDFRGMPDEELDLALGKFYFLDPFSRAQPGPSSPVFLVLDETYHDDLMPYTAGGPPDMRIPPVEVWYPRDLALSKIRLVIDVRIQRRPTEPIAPSTWPAEWLDALKLAEQRSKDPRQRMK